MKTLNYFIFLILIIVGCKSNDFDIEGKWIGENIPGRKIDITFNEKDKSFILIQKEDQLKRGNYVLDMNHDPKWIDLYFKNSEESYLGIIEVISENKITIQLGTNDKRPIEFSTSKGDDDENVILTREQNE